MPVEQAMAVEKRVNQSVVRLIKGDITDIEIEAFVFYARHDLVLGTGFGTAISTRGGPTIQKELEGLAPLQTGEAVVTAAGNLKAGYIVHAVGPRFQEEDIEGKLRTTILSSLKCADEKGIKQIALPAMGAGFYGIPLDVCARVMLGTTKSYLEGETGIEEVILCVLDSREYEPFNSELSKLN